MPDLGNDKELPYMHVRLVQLNHFLVDTYSSSQIAHNKHLTFVN